jgi:hypothetical protein
MALSFEKIQRVAGFELNALRSSGTIGTEYEKLTISKTGTPIYDLNGSILFYRLPLVRDRIILGFTDIAADESFGEPLLSTSMGQPWDENALLKIGADKFLGIKRTLKYDAMRFVAYSFPKIALQFLSAGKEILMLELYTWNEVPPISIERRKPLQAANFERWSLLDELPSSIKKTRVDNFNQRVKNWEGTAFKKIDPSTISMNLLRTKDYILKLVKTQEVHYSPNQNDHHPCYELRGQQTNVWCVGASCQMLLLFYRYNYDQVRLATELGLGTLASPNGLPYANVGKVVDVLEKLTSNALDATMYTNPAWSLFQNEINANRPMISFIPGHSRTVAGYTESMSIIINQVPFKGLLVYDPWPPTTGVITRWENFATQTYQYAYTAILKQI